MSKTEDALKEAFAGESQANRKYLALFAVKADSVFPRLNQVVQSKKEFISYLFYCQSFRVFKHHLVFKLEPVRFNLQGIGIDLSFPKPFCATELNIIWINIRYSLQRIEKHPAQRTVFNTEGNVGYPILYFDNRIINRQGFQVLRIVLAAADKMTKTALQRETIRQFIKSIDQFDDGFIDHPIAETGQASVPLFLEMRVFQ